VASEKAPPLFDAAAEKFQEVSAHGALGLESLFALCVSFGMFTA